MTQILSVFPRFLVRDVARTLTYYQDVLGFEVSNSSGNPPVFGIVERDGCGIHVRRGEPRAHVAIDEAWDAYFEVQDVDALHAELSGRGAFVIRGPERLPYGMKEFEITDPDGYVICFAEDVEGR